MSQIIEVKVPDIGNFHDVPILDVCVAVGATVDAEDPLLTLESDKATIDIPAPAAGVLKEFTVKVGDKVSVQIKDLDWDRDRISLSLLQQKNNQLIP